LLASSLKIIKKNKIDFRNIKRACSQRFIALPLERDRCDNQTNTQKQFTSGNALNRGVLARYIVQKFYNIEKEIIIPITFVYNIIGL
jgi:hypothetical protein